MHPAYSVILFTTASGAGYGLLGLLAAFGAAGLVPAERWLGLAGFGAGFALVTVGLLASSFHLGHPERAWRAFSQWRTSWLSREGVLAVATYVPAGLFALGWVVFETTAQPWALAGWLTVIAVTATVFCTGMIYASLRTIRRWHHPLVVPAYLALALATGAVCLNLLLTVFVVPAPWAAWLAMGALGLGMVVKMAYWASADGARKSYTAGAATGLGRYGEVRPLDPPHTQPNYVMREMGYTVARKHAARLRFLALLFGFVAPMALTSLTLTSALGPGWLWAALALVSAALGVAIERWLFFAEAQHVVMLYYGASAA